MNSLPLAKDIDFFSIEPRLGVLKNKILLIGEYYFET